jgi:hypothetical protein
VDKKELVLLQEAAGFTVFALVRMGSALPG